MWPPSSASSKYFGNSNPNWQTAAPLPPNSLRVFTRSGPSAANIRIEVLCDDHLASAIAEDLQARYYERYGMVIFIADVLVLHPGKF